MCGIGGLVNFDGDGIDAGILGRMIELIRHRGPDSNGTYTDAYAGLANARLSIIDPDGGRQPLANEDRSLWITFNGEIFNHVELRDELSRKGHRFKSRCDTEVILHLYEEMGEDCVQRFNGQWAFAIWDARRRRLFLSRDRLGVRPLFYASANRLFLFGSEIKCIFAHPAVRRGIDPIALDQVFTVWSTLPPRTIFEGIRELPPGHSMTVEGGTARVRSYWRLEFPPPEGMEEEECADRVLELLLDATRLRLRSDVPVGSYLSGGLDSSLIAGLVRRATGEPPRTFSITFEDPEFDESGPQREVSSFLGSQHRSIHCSSAAICRVFPEVIWHAETPVLRTAPAPLYLLSGLAHNEGYKVVLAGEGSDEVFGGYDIFKESKIRRFWAACPESRLRPLLLRRLYPYLKSLQAQPGPYLRAFFQVTQEHLASPFFSHLPRWQLTAKLKVFLSDGVRSAVQGYDILEELEARLPEDYSRWDPLSQAQYLEAAVLFPGYILSSQGDRMSMAHSVEVRLPFLDPRVVEFAVRIPPRLRMRALMEKYILRRAARGLVPATVERRPKQPYRAPEAKSFWNAATGKPYQDYVGDLLSAECIRRDGLFRPSAVEKLIDKVQSGRPMGIKDNMAVVGILSTQLVLAQFVGRFSRFGSHVAN